MAWRRWMAAAAVAAGAATIAACAAAPDHTDMSDASVSTVKPAASAQLQQIAATDQVARGKYLVLIAGCNDCHTPGWERNPDHVPMNQWLIGKSVGFKGPWGVTYPDNLRRKLSRISADQWVHWVRHGHALPPMPWASLQAMSDSDLRAMYAFVHQLGAAGPRRPHHVHPGQRVHTPYIDFEVKRPDAG